MSLPHDLKQQLEYLARGFKQFPKNPSSKVHKAIREVLAEIAYKADCSDVLNQDWDGESGFRPQLNPDIPFEKVYEFYGDDWTSVLRKADTAFDRLCRDFLDVIANDPRAKMDEDDAMKILDEAIQENFWSEFSGEFDGEKFSDVYDDVRDGCPEYTDPHEYHGVSRSDFMASRRASRTLTASDRSSLIRLASSLPAGDEMRRAILAGLSAKTASDPEYELSAPDDAGSMRGARKWLDFIKFYILGNTAPDSPERARAIGVAKKNLSYASFLFRRNRGVAAFYDQSRSDLDKLSPTVME